MYWILSEGYAPCIKKLALITCKIAMHNRKKSKNTQVIEHNVRVSLLIKIPEQGGKILLPLLWEVLHRQGTDS